MKEGQGKSPPSVSAVSRRDFIKLSGMAVVGIYMTGCKTGGLGREKAEWGFILVDTKKCQGCQSCMLACSLVHEGIISLSSSRIQVLNDPYGSYPDDITISQCRQCTQPACLAACPIGALARDPAHGNVATIDPAKCIGCKSCINACSWAPARAIWNNDAGYSQKCDLCASASHWDETGGPDGKKACVEICPLGAITFSKIIPAQDDPDSYTVNLRDRQWRKLGYPRF
jgi:Fe-S-cluster-containing dehydrogenase component